MKIALPPETAGLAVVVSVSGGKDSTALLLALREAGIDYRAVFADTGWEAPETYEYLDLLRDKLGSIDVVGAPGGMVARIKYRSGFPSRTQRWCTRELKIEPLQGFHAEVGEGETVSVVGIRAEESQTRAAMLEVENDERWGGWVWRPLLHWTVQDVLEIHRRHGVPVNPLYHVGFSRVGCYPCIFANKEEIRLLAQHAPRRIDDLRALENACGFIRAARNAVQPGRYTHEQGTFFLSIVSRGGHYNTIDEVVDWAKTSHGGLQTQMFTEPRGGCYRWGLCDVRQ